MSCVQVKGLETGTAYVFKVRAVNEQGVGKASDISDSVVAKALPGITHTAHFTIDIYFVLIIISKYYIMFRTITDNSGGCFHRG